MKKLISLITAVAVSVSAISFAAVTFADTASSDVWMPNPIRTAETLDRGLVAMQTTGGIYLSWRLQADEDNVYGTGTSNVSFDIYRDGTYLATESNTTNYTDTDGTAASKYQVVVSGENKSNCKEVTAFSSGSNYFDIAVNKPEATTLPRTATFKSASGSSYIGFTDAEGNQISSWRSENAVWDPAEYAINDASCGDLDGDGEYEIVVKWDCWGKDNSQTGLTGTVYLDAYKLDGTRLWRIDLGRNIRAGAHYTQFLVYDFDGDGKAEVTCKTAPGSKDGTGAYVSSASSDSTINSTDNTASYINDSGYILDGPEYFTIFNGQTGAAEDTIYYPNQRVNVSVWGDNYGNRVDRYTADVAYLDGTTPYAVYMRGYYFGSGQRQAACAVSFDGSKLNCKYSFDTYDVTSYSNKSSSSSYDSNGNYKGVNGYRDGNGIYVGQGNHNCTVADVDNDGRDEVLTGALCYELDTTKDILTPKWCTFKGHGDALHIGDYDPTHSGYEFFVVHEEGGGTDTMSGQNVTLDFGMSLIDAATGNFLFHKSASKDTGRGMMANVGAGGYYQMNAGSQVAAHIAKGNDVYEESSYSFSNNFRIFWDGDLYDELLDGTTITAWNKNTLSMQSVFTADGCVSVNGSKANPSLQADLFGDWREEVAYPLSDSSALRVYTTNIYTKYKMKSLMYDGVYRSGVAAEQTAYNQPPHIGYYIEPPVINEETIYEKGTNSDTAWLAADTAAWTQSGTAQLQYSASGADYGDIYYTETNPSSSYSATKNFDIKSGATVTYNLIWRYGGVINKNATNMDSNTNYTYLQFGDNIRLAWFGAPSYYYLYYSTDGGTTYTASNVKYYNQTYRSNVIATVDTSTNTLTSLSVDGKELVSNTKVSDTPDSVTFGFIRGNASLFSNATPDTAIDSIKVTQEYETTSESTPKPIATATPTPTPNPENFYTFDEDVAAVTESGVTTWDSGSLNGWFLNRADTNGTVQVKDGGLNVYVNTNGNKTYLGLHADTTANVKDKIVKFGFDYKTSSISTASNSCTEIVVLSTDDNDITWSSWSSNGAVKKTSETGIEVNTVYNVLYTINNADHTISYTITDSEGSVVKEESLTNNGNVDINTIVFRTGKNVTDVIDNFWYTVKSAEEPTPSPTPTAIPTATPTVKPTATPTAIPTATPTVKPTATPTVKPTATPTATPTVNPTTTPTAAPTQAPEGYPYTIDSITETNTGFTVNVSENRPPTDTAVVIIALYDDKGVLKGVNFKELGDSLSVTIDMNDVQYTKKAVFIWNSANKMIPMSEPYRD